MAWLRTSAGLKIWVLVWLLVLFIPRWRQDAREQWSGDAFDASSSQSGLTPEKIEQIAARVPDDWAAQLELQGARYGSENFSLDTAKRATYFDGYARLSRRFPRENAIRQAWLLDLSRGSLDIDPPSTYAGLAPRDRPRQPLNWLPDAQLETALKAAREGAQIEPQNSFFPWMESVFDFALHRPGDAMRAIERAAKCRDFDDGTLQTARQRVALLERVQSVGWNEKERVMWTLLLPHFAKIRASSRAALNVARQAQKRGDKKRALQIAALTARAAATISDSGDAYITVVIGDFMQIDAWQSALKNAGLPVARQKGTARTAQENLQIDGAVRQENARRVAILARELGQNGIATQVLTTLPQLRGARLEAASNGPPFGSDGLSQRTNRLMQFLWGQAELMRLSLASALAWLIAFGFTFRTELPTILRRGVAISAAFCGGITLVLLVGGSFVFGLVLSQEISGNAGGVPLDWRDLQGKLNVGLAFLWVFPAVLTAIWNGFQHSRNRGKKLTALRGLKMLIYSAMIIGAVALALSSSPVQASTWIPARDVASFLLIGATLAAGVFHVVTAGGKTRIAAMLFWSVPWVVWGLCGALGPFIDNGRGVGFEWFIGVVCFALLVASAQLGGLLNERQRAFPLSAIPLRQEFLNFAGRVRILGATLAVASAIFYVEAKIAAVPAEAKLNALIDEQLKTGEVARLEAQTARVK